MEKDDPKEKEKEKEEEGKNKFGGFRKSEERRSKP